MINSGVSGGDRYYIASLQSAASACQEEEHSIPSWCGRASEEQALRWSTDSNAVAYVSSAGALVVTDLRLVDDGYVEKPIATQNCTTSCAGGFRFQP
ncbi:MAG: hypothetical protein QM784_31410 [Polyangiaceae bacterium]